MSSPTPGPAVTEPTDSAQIAAATAPSPRTDAGVHADSADQPVPGLTPERAKTLFSGVADLYAAHRPGYPGEAFQYLARALRFGPAGRLVDVGCGPGTISLTVAALAGRVAAVDPNPEMLDAARRSATALGLANLDFHQGRAEELPDLPLGRVDHALFGRSFHWTDRVRVIGVLDRLLPADGAIVLINPARGDRTRARVWDPVLERVAARFIGERGPENDPRAVVPTESHSDLLAASVFSQLERTRYVARQQYTLDRVVGLQSTFSYSTPIRLGDRAEEFAAAVRQALLDGLGPGPYPVEEYTDVLVARRPAR